MTQLEVGAAIVAVTEGIKRVFPKINGWITIVVAAVLGVLAGVLGLAGLNWASGLVVGLSAAGVVKVGTAIGGN